MKTRQNAPSGLSAAERELFHGTQAALRAAGRWHDGLDVPVLERYCRAVTAARDLRDEANRHDGDERRTILELALQADRDAAQYARDLNVTPSTRAPRAGAAPAPPRRELRF